MMLALGGSAMACAPFPDLGDPVPAHLEDADYPALLPNAGLPVEDPATPATGSQTGPQTGAPEDALLARAAALRARAARLARR